MKNVVGSGAPDRVLIDLLKKHRWNVDRAVDEYFSSGMSS